MKFKKYYPAYFDTDERIEIEFESIESLLSHEIFKKVSTQPGFVKFTQSVCKGWTDEDGQTLISSEWKNGESWVFGRVLPAIDLGLETWKEK